MTHVLTGKKRICEFVGRSWATIHTWIEQGGFPARKIDGIWESDAQLVTAWRQAAIKGEKSMSIAKDMQ
jgi:hypothetical protein